MVAEISSGFKCQSLLDNRTQGKPLGVNAEISRSRSQGRVGASACRRLLSRGNKRMSDDMHRECDSVLHSQFMHQFRYMRLDRAFLNAQGSADLLVGAACYQ